MADAKEKADKGREKEVELMAQVMVMGMVTVMGDCNG